MNPPAVRIAGIQSGSVRAAGDVWVEGVLYGDVEAEGSIVRIPPGGRIEGNVFARGIRVEGELIGQCRAEAIWLGPTAQVRGDLGCQLLQLDAGVRFFGRMESQGAVALSWWFDDAALAVEPGPRSSVLLPPAGPRRRWPIALAGLAAACGLAYWLISPPVAQPGKPKTSASAPPSMRVPAGRRRLIASRRMSLSARSRGASAPLPTIVDIAWLRQVVMLQSDTVEVLLQDAARHPLSAREDTRIHAATQNLMQGRALLFKYGGINRVPPFRALNSGTPPRQPAEATWQQYLQRLDALVVSADDQGWPDDARHYLLQLRRVGHAETPQRATTSISPG